MKFTVGIVGHDKRPHMACFEDVAKALAEALRTLGHEVTDFDNPGRLIMFGANHFSDPYGLMPADAILFNTEQVAAATYRKQINHDQYKKHVIWDYSESNIVRLKELGVERAVHCPIGYLPSMTTIKPVENEDIDVLFYGAMNDRRKAILEILEVRGLRIAHLYGVYGKARDEVITRARVVLNIHFYDNPIFEIFRCSQLFSNSKCVVSEDGGQDYALESFARGACALVPYSKMAETCRNLLENTEDRKAMEKRGFTAFSAINFLDSVRRAVLESTP